MGDWHFFIAAEFVLLEEVVERVLDVAVQDAIVEVVAFDIAPRDVKRLVGEDLLLRHVHEVLARAWVHNLSRDDVIAAVVDVGAESHLGVRLLLRGSCRYGHRN